VQAAIKEAKGSITASVDGKLGLRLPLPEHSVAFGRRRSGARRIVLNAFDMANIFS